MPPGNCVNLKSFLHENSVTVQATTLSGYDYDLRNEKMRVAASLEGLVKTAIRGLGEQLSAGHAVVELGLETNGYTLARRA